MTLEPLVLLTILGMSLVTYFTRAGGLLILGRVRLSKRVEKGLSYIPGAVLISIVAPEVIKGGLAGAVAALATALVALRTGSLLAAMVVGVALTWAMRSFL